MIGQPTSKFQGWWTKGEQEPKRGDHAIQSAIQNVTRPVFLLNQNGQMSVCHKGTLTVGDAIRTPSTAYPVIAYVPPLHPKELGDPQFKKVHNLRYAYVAGAMANGITSVRMVEEAGRAGLVGFFGAAGLSLNEIEAAINRLQSQTEKIPFGFNLIHSPMDPELEAATVRLYLKRGIRLVSASAYLDITAPLVLYRVKGIHTDPDGNLICPNKIIAKVSRIEVARKFFSPPPDKLLGQLLEKRLITSQEAILAKQIPLVEDLTAEADSGGHTDNRPALTLLPTMLALRDEMRHLYGYKQAIRIGLGGGIATPVSTAASFAMGAAYVLTGSINQSCIESGTSDTVRQMLAQAEQADVSMAPAADMFEMGVRVQVLKRGTLFPFRAAKLYELYCNYSNFESIPEKQKTLLERDFFRSDFETAWDQTKVYFLNRDPQQIERAEADPKHKMALVFRSYLGQSSNWANTGEPSRKIDYQIWCGPSMGAFNQWVKGSYLEKPENRKIVTVAMNLLFGAAVLTRVNWLRSQGVSLPTATERFYPLSLPEIHKVLEESPG